MGRANLFHLDNLSLQRKQALMKSKTKTAKNSKSLRDLKLKKGNVKGGGRGAALNTIKTRV